MSSHHDAPGGADRFAGTWVTIAAGDELPELAGRVALLGDPAGIVAVAPGMVEVAELIKVFYPDPVWVVPTSRAASWAAPRRSVRTAAAVAVRRALPGSRSDVPEDVIAAAARHLLDAEVPDRWTRRQLTPHPQDLDAAIVRSDDFYVALGRDCCELITWPVAAICEHGVRTADGLEHHVDTIVDVTAR